MTLAQLYVIEDYMGVVLISYFVIFSSRGSGLVTMLPVTCAVGMYHDITFMTIGQKRRGRIELQIT